MSDRVIVPLLDQDDRSLNSRCKVNVCEGHVLGIVIGAIVFVVTMVCLLIWYWIDKK
jgi:hypothetical protein